MASEAACLNSAEDETLYAHPTLPKVLPLHVSLTKQLARGVAVHPRRDYSDSIEDGMLWGQRRVSILKLHVYLSN